MAKLTFEKEICNLEHFKLKVKKVMDICRKIIKNLQLDHLRLPYSKVDQINSLSLSTASISSESFTLLETVCYSYSIYSYYFSYYFYLYYSYYSSNYSYYSYYYLYYSYYYHCFDLILQFHSFSNLMYLLLIRLLLYFYLKIIKYSYYYSNYDSIY